MVSVLIRNVGPLSLPFLSFLAFKARDVLAAKVDKKQHTTWGHLCFQSA